MATIADLGDVQMLLADPAIDADLLSKDTITLHILLVLSPTTWAHGLVMSPSALRTRNRLRRWNSWRESLTIQPVHDKLFHAFASIVELRVGHISPNLALTHLVGYEGQKIPNDFDLLMDHPLSLSEF